MPGKVFENVELLAKDSMFIFIEVTANVIDANTTDFLYTDLYILLCRKWVTADYMQE
jgi:hypothetical protein